MLQLEDVYNSALDAKPATALEMMYNHMLFLIDITAPEEDTTVVPVIDDLHNGKSIAFTRSEMWMLNCLASLIDKTARKQAIHTAYMAHKGNETEEKIVDVYICHIRKKLNPKYEILTIWGEGYKLQERKT